MNREREIFRLSAPSTLADLVRRGIQSSILFYNAICQFRPGHISLLNIQNYCQQGIFVYEIPTAAQKVLVTQTTDVTKPD